MCDITRRDKVGIKESTIFNDIGGTVLFKEILNGILNAATPPSPLNPVADLYAYAYRAFGLKPYHLLRQEETVPVWVRSDPQGFVSAFEIHGNALNVPEFLANSHYGVFRDIRNAIVLPVGMSWVFDLSEINEGKMRGWGVPTGSHAHLQSEEILHLLGVIGATRLPPLEAVPIVKLGFGSIWERYGIPDDISITLHGYFLNTDPFDELRTNILDSYIQRGNVNGVKAAYRVVFVENTLNIVFSEPSATTENLAVPDAAAKSDEDGFPYDFYRGLGLIDEEDKVIVQTILGPMRVDMREEDARATLLAYKPSETGVGE